ncbi:DUF1223 domain-containing protein [Pontiellaceae bacterium B12219]|nr:DUF1223 domain-containing protein [Pontiellaceae bacterium B12219]
MKIPILLAILSGTGSLLAAPQTFTSSDRQTSLIELYTSEGCSSCPPAEQKMNHLENHPGLWTELVPVAFHVDYWNYIGWPDRFSRPEYTARQRQYSKHWKSRTVYTPCFVENGKPVRSCLPKHRKASAGILTATLHENQIEIRFSPDVQPSEKLSVWVTPLSGSEITKVKSGENRGRTLKHCFVALDLSQTPLTLQGEDLVATVPYNSGLNAKALAVWVEAPNRQKPIQATGGWLK